MRHKKNIILFLLIVIVLSGIILNRELNNLDELWNYNFARNIAEGNVPYKDFNMLQMPLLPIIASIFLRILGNELIVMRLLAIVLCSTIIFIVYQILRKLKISSSVSLLSILAIGYLLKDYFCIDYNFTILLNVLLIMYLEIKYLDKSDFARFDVKHDCIIGILAGMCIIYKQSTGIIVAIACVGYKLLLVTNKEIFKEYLKIAITRLVGILIPVRVNYGISYV